MVDPQGTYPTRRATARRRAAQFQEEIGFTPTGRFWELTPVRQAGGKIIHAWAVEGDCDPAALRSNMFEIEWPPRSGRMQSFPEIDRATWFALDEARSKIIKGQAALLDQLRALVEMPG